MLKSRVTDLLSNTSKWFIHHILQCCLIGVFNHDNLPMTLVAVNWMFIEVSCRVSTSLSVVTLRSLLWLHLPHLVCFSRFSDIIRCHFNLLVRHYWTRNFKTYTLTCYFSTSLKCQHSQKALDLAQQYIMIPASQHCCWLYINPVNRIICHWTGVSSFGEIYFLLCFSESN